MTARELAVELCELTPVELDGLVFSYEPRLPYNASMSIPDMDKLAEALLERESPGDILTRIERTRGSDPDWPLGEGLR